MRLGRAEGAVATVFALGGVARRDRVGDDVRGRASRGGGARGAWETAPRAEEEEEEDPEGPRGPPPRARGGGAAAAEVRGDALRRRARRPSSARGARGAWGREAECAGTGRRATGRAHRTNNAGRDDGRRRDGRATEQRNAHLEVRGAFFVFLVYRQTVLTFRLVNTAASSRFSPVSTRPLLAFLGRRRRRRVARARAAGSPPRRPRSRARGARSMARWDSARRALLTVASLSARSRPPPR